MSWRLFWLLWVAGMLAGLCFVPLFALMPFGVPWRLAAIIIGVVGGAVLALSILVGLRLGPRLGLGAPILEARLAGARCEDASNRLLTGLGLGAAMGAVAIVAAVIVAPDVASESAAAMEMPQWAGLVLAVGAAVDEELIYRLGLMTLVAWLAARVFPGEAGRARAIGMWIAVLITAVLFEVSHLPPAGLAAFDGALPLRAVRLATAVVICWLYWRRGLESAIAAHFAYNMAVFYGVAVSV